MLVKPPASGRWVPGNRWDELDGVWPSAPPTVSVVVLHYRQPRELARTLAALDRQTHPSQKTEIIVVDDGSPQPPEVPAGVALVRGERNSGRRGAVRNRGAARCGGDVLCFLDADTTPEPDYLRQLTRLPALAPEAVVVGHRRHADLRTVAVDAPIADVGPAQELSEPAWLRDGYTQTRDLLNADDRSYRFVISAVLGCTRWFFEDTRGFAEEFDQYGGEDWEWAHRAWQRGALLAHVPTAVAWHDGPEWASRRTDPDARRAIKNAEAIALSRLISVAGSRGHAVHPERADIIARLPEDTSAPAAFVCVDSLLAALPEAVVIVAEAIAAIFAGDNRVMTSSSVGDPRLTGSRLTIEIISPVRVHGDGLRWTCGQLAGDRFGVCTISDDAGPLLAVISARHRARVRRWGASAGFPTLAVSGDWLTRLTDEPDVETYLGGWN